MFAKKKVNDKDNGYLQLSNLNEACLTEMFE